MKLIGARVREWRWAPISIFSVALLVLVGALVLIVQNERTYNDSRTAQARTEAEVLAASVAAPLDFADPAAAQESVNAFRADRQVRMIGVYSRDGRAIAGYRRDGRPVAARAPDLPAAESTAIRVEVPAQASGQTVGNVVFELDRAPLGRRLTRYAVIGSLGLLAALVISAIGFAQLVLRRANLELADRAVALAQANTLLEEQIEERAKAEEQLRQSQKMQALGQLTGGIAHDFNNLLTVIQGSADMLCRDELTTQRRQRFARAIVQASASAAALTSQLLAFARRQPLKPEALDLNQVVADMRDLIAGTMGERILLSTEYGELSCPTKADRAQLQSAILNIASNARDAMDGGGRLSLVTRQVEEPGGAMLALDIVDTGVGMDGPTLERVFEPFFTTKQAGRGTGLGLSQVYGFASQSGGDVRVESRPGGGTRVTLLLPCAAGEASDAPSRGGAVAEVEPIRILVVEDNDEVGAFAENLLAELGHRVIRARSGEEALTLVRAEPFDLVFSDVVMPGMGGLRLAELLAEEQPRLPVILATGYSEEIADAGSGGRPVILKPYRIAVLSQAIAEAMREAAE